MDRRPGGAGRPERRYAGAIPGAPPKSARDRWTSVWRVHKSDAGFALAAVLLSSLGAAAVLRLWHADLGVPFAMEADALFFQTLVKAALEHPWILSNPDLGAPFGQELYDYPVAGADAVHVLGIKLIGLFVSSPAAVLNAYFLLSFPLAALTAYGVLRWLRLSGPVAVAAAVLFALAPYHFLRGETHYFLAVYFQVPLAAYLVLAISLGAPLFDRRANALLTVAICVVVGLSDLYYVAFTVLLAAGATVVASVARRERRTLIAGTVVTLTLVAVPTLAIAPNLIYRANHGGNPVLDRVAEESEVFSLNLTRLILPVQSHRVDRLESFRARYTAGTKVGRESSPLGALAGAGFLWLLAVALAMCFGAAGRVIRDARQRSLAAANLMALLVGTTGGVSSLIAYAVTPQLRTWSRLSIFIAFFALAALGLLADAAWSRYGARRRWSGPLALGALGAVVLIAVLDQTTSFFVPRYAEAAAEYRSDDAFVQRIEKVLEDEAPVFQLPYMRFPDELEFARLHDYDHARGYLHSTDLRWSYGAMRGRDEDWQASTVNMSLSALVPMVSAAGFQGIYLDRYGYSDNGASAEAELRRIVGVVPLTSANGRLTFFDMRRYNRALRAAHPPSQISALATATLTPLQISWPRNAFAPEERDGNDAAQWSVLPDARFRILNPSSRPRSAALAVTLATPGGEAVPTVLGFPDGSSQRLLVRPEATRVVRRIRFPPGESWIRLASFATPVAAGEGSGIVRLTGFQLMPVEVLPMMDARPEGSM